jgi:hypothetical protein
VTTRHVPAWVILGAALAVQLALMLHVWDRAYGDVLKAVNFAHLLDTGAYEVGRDMVNSKTFVGPWLGYRLFDRWGLVGLRAANAAIFLLLGALVLALGRGRFDVATRHLALFLFAFYPGTQRSIVAGELDDQLATLFLAIGILVYLDRRRVFAGAVLVGMGFLFKFWVAAFGLGFLVFLLVTRRARCLPIALAGLGLPFVAVSVLDGGGSLHALFVSLGLSVHHSTWDKVAFKVFSTGLLPCAAVAVASWAEGERRDVDTLFLCLALSYVAYIFVARDAWAASTMMMTWLMFGSYLLAAWMLRRARALGPTARRAVAIAFLTLYPAAATTIAYVNLYRDTLPIRLFDTTDEVARTFRYNARLTELP